MSFPEWGLDAGIVGSEERSTATQARLTDELQARGVRCARFVRAPNDYYARSLAYRRDTLRAPSVDHLCKSMVMVNTRAHASVRGMEDPRNSKYYLVIVQYTARLNAEKLRVAIHAMSGGDVPKKYYNIRMAPEAESDRLTGFVHNAVSPVGLATPLPIIMSHRILQLHPPLLWQGGGEPDVKLGMPTVQFVAAYHPIVMDCTYDDEGGGGGRAHDDDVPTD